jgi:protease YdgD
VYPWPWRAIGHVYRGGGNLCTGALVAPDLVLTARHCLIDPTTGTVSADGVTFAAGFRLGVFEAEARASSVIARDVVRPSGTQTAPSDTGGTTDFEIGMDFALIRLGTAMSIRPLPVASDERLKSVMAAPSYVVLPSYSHDHRDILTLHERCIVEGRFEDPLWSHSCDGTAGASGSPVLVDALGDRQNAAIAGVLVGYRRVGGSPRGIMVPAPVIRAFLRRNGIVLE